MSNEAVSIGSYWQILPPGMTVEKSRPGEGVPVIRIKPGVGFGDGSHETTRLCLTALGYLLRSGLRPKTVLDFGAGTGILAIAAALSGAKVEAVEIDEAAVAEARDNAGLNGVGHLVELAAVLQEPAGKFDLVFANILRGVLMEHAAGLCVRQSRAGHMILSGLVATDVPDILAKYRPLLQPMRAKVYAQGEWRAIMFSG